MYVYKLCTGSNHLTQRAGLFGGVYNKIRNPFQEVVRILVVADVGRSGDVGVVHEDMSH